MRRGVVVSRSVDWSMRSRALRKAGLRGYGRGGGRGSDGGLLLMRRLQVEIGAIRGLSLVRGWMRRRI